MQNLSLSVAPPHAPASASTWLLRWSHLLPPSARVLDLACGFGRHVRWLAAQGHQVTAVDRDAPALAGLADHFRTENGAKAQANGLRGKAPTLVCADLETNPWPLPGQTFHAVLVTNYLWRPLMPAVLAAVEPGGWLLYETFGAGQASIGRPARPEFLLQAGELLTMVAAWRVLAFEDGFDPELGRFVQRIVARRPTPSDTPSMKLPLTQWPVAHR